MAIESVVEWNRRDAVFHDNRYPRAHTWRFDGGAEVSASSSPDIVPVPMSDANAVDPEEAFVASLSSCHMLWFLSIAAKEGFVVDRYVDHAKGEMRKNDEGKLMVDIVTLRPDVQWFGDRHPTDKEVMNMHERAHEECFIANSVRTTVQIQPTERSFIPLTDMHLNEALGFERVGTFRHVGLKFGKRLDVTNFQLALSASIEGSEPKTEPSTSPTGSVETSFLIAAKGNLESSAAKIRHCVGQLDDEQLWWRPTPLQNSIGNLILHLCGNVGQWIISGVGGTKDVRDRPSEFAADKRLPKTELSALLDACVEQAGRTLATTPDPAVLSRRRIQGFDTTVLSAVLNSVSHFQGHTQEIISLTRQQLGERYTFDFIPTTAEQISASSTE